MIALDNSVLPVPFCVSAPAIKPVAPELNVKRPLLDIVRGPVPVVVIVLLKVIAFPVREIPEAPVVFKAPLYVVVPLQPSCAIDADEIAWVETLLPLVMLKAVKGVAPTLPLKVIDPVSARKVSA